MKPGATLVLGETDPELAPIFTARGPERDRAARPRLRCAGERGRGRWTARRAVHSVRDLHRLFLPLHGAHQADNAAAALAAAECFLDRALGDDIVEAALVSVQSPGRLEVVGHNPLVVIDGTKNVAGARAVAPRSPRNSRNRATWVIGVLQQKDAPRCSTRSASPPTTP